MACEPAQPLIVYLSDLANRGALGCLVTHQPSKSSQIAFLSVSEAGILSMVYIFLV